MADCVRRLYLTHGRRRFDFPDGVAMREEATPFATNQLFQNTSLTHKYLYHRTS